MLVKTLNALYRELEFHRLRSEEVRDADARVDGATYTACSTPTEAEAALSAAGSAGAVRKDPRSFDHPARTVQAAGKHAAATGLRKVFVDGDAPPLGAAT